MISKYYPEFITITCLNWLPVLRPKDHKDIIIESLRFLVQAERVKVSCFVVMENHFHLIWQVMGDHTREDVQRDFLRFTAQQILKNLRNNKSQMLSDLLVQSKDRKYQVWERNSLSIELRNPMVYNQKLEYVHANPVNAGLCEFPEEYEYSTARFYELNERNWDFVSHYED